MNSHDDLSSNIALSVCTDFINGNNSGKTVKRDKIYTLQIILTNDCNLHCKYCYVRRDTIRAISIDTAKKAISNMIDKYPPSDWMYDLCFMGGEPLVEFNKIKEISEWVWQTFPEIDIQISAPTNGTLLNETIRTWLNKNHTRFSLGLSYDGDYAQDNNRSNSAAMIDVTYFKNLWPEQPLKMTISEHHVDCLAKNITLMQKQGNLISANVACGEQEWSNESISEFGRQMLILAQYYIDHPEVTPIDLLNVNLCQVFFQHEQMIRRCGIGFNYDTIDVDGTSYPCHLFSSLALTSQEIREAKKFRMGERNDFTVDSCKECVLNPICPRCYGMAYLRTGNPFTVDKNVCRLFKQQIKGACSYQIKRMSRLNSLSSQDHYIICAIKTIMENLHFE